MINTDTICAPATATGGAIAVVRVSGPEALAIVSRICHIRCDSIAANTIRYTHIHDGSQLIDEAMISVFRAPKSYTGEDSVEISCHGSRYIISKILELLVHNGCRMANPGEYTMRAYLNGKLDLSQAEAVADLIASTNKATHQIALSQLRGNVSNDLQLLRDQLLKLTSLLELELDFSDHEELEFADHSELMTLACQIDEHVSRLAQTFQTGQAIKQGIPVAIVGKTNVGKSTLLNALLKDNRAIVSDIHGTTRDTIEDTIDIQGVTFRFIDTAGIRQTSDQVEQIGISRTYQAIQKARIIIWLVDAPPTPNELADIEDRTQDKALLIVRNKSDLNNQSIPSNPNIPNSLLISAKYGEGLAALEAAIYQAADIPEIKESDIIITSVRHYDALLRAHESLLRVIEGMNINLSGDLLAEDLRQVLDILAEITGSQITTNEVLGNIFQHFCVGK